MRVRMLFLNIATAIVVVSTVIAAIGLLHGLTTAHGLHMLMHELEKWVVTVGYHLALIVLAASAVAYVAQKK